MPPPVSIRRRAWLVVITSCLAVFCGCPSKKENKPLPKIEKDKSSEAIPAEDKPQGSKSEQGSESDEMSEATPDNASDTADGQQKTAGNSSNASVDLLKDGDWTSKRIVVLAPTGPNLVEIIASIEGQSLSDSSRLAIADLAQALLSAPTETLADDATKQEQNSEQSSQQTESTSPDSTNTADGSNDPTGEPTSSPTTWKGLLENDLISSGWLGNLIAEDDRQDDLIEMYDDGDGMVSMEELEPFLTRGLNRQDAFAFC